MANGVINMIATLLYGLICLYYPDISVDYIVLGATILFDCVFMGCAVILKIKEIK